MNSVFQTELSVSISGSALASGKRLPAGVMATTLSTEKSQLKGRLLGIMNYRKKTAWTIALMILITLALVGCAAVYPAFDSGEDASVNSVYPYYETGRRQSQDNLNPFNYRVDADKQLEAFTKLAESAENLVGESPNINLNIDYDTFIIVVRLGTEALFDSDSATPSP